MMIETINVIVAIAILIFSLIGKYFKKDWMEIVGFLAIISFLTYTIGFHLGKNEFSSAVIPSIVILLLYSIIIWKFREFDAEEERTYSREELIIAKKIYDSNYLANPEDFEDIKGTYEDAQVSIDYLLGIIDADSKKYKKVMYGTRKAES